MAAGQQQQVSLGNIFQTIKQAQELDEAKNELEAHQRYLSAVHYISVFLQQQQIHNSCPLPPQRISQLFTIAKQCLEQAEALHEKSVKENRRLIGKPPLVSSVSLPSVPLPSPPLPGGRGRSGCHQTDAVPLRSSSVGTRNVDGGTHTPGIRSNTISSTAGARSNTISSTTATRSNTISSTAGTRSNTISSTPGTRSNVVGQKPQAVNALHQISPMEVARRKNMHLMVQYQAALRNNPNMSLRGSQNLSLNYLRRLEENLSVARITERTMAMKLRQREIRLQEEAQKQKVRSVESLTPEQLKDEVAHFENGKAKLNALKQALLSNNDDNTTNSVVNLIHEVLNSTDHPLRRLFGECQYTVMQALQPVVRDIASSGCSDVPMLNITPLQKDHTSPSPSSSWCEQRTSPTVKGRPHLGSEPRDIKDVKLSSQTMEGTSFHAMAHRSPSSSTASSNVDNDEMNNADDDDDDNGMETLSDFKTLKERRDEDILNDDDDDFQTLKAAEYDDEEEDDLTTLKSEKEEANISNEEEEEEEVVFPSLLPLSCTPLFGDKDKMRELTLKYEGLLEDTVKLIHSALKKIISSFVLIYHPLSSVDNYDICQTAIESLFFPAILPMLTSLYRCIKYESECAVAVNMMKHVNSTPKDISVRKKYWLNDRIKPPYLAAIEQLKSLPRLQCPSLKLDCLVTLSKIIVQTIEDYYFTSPSSSFSSSSSSSDRGMTREDIAVGVDDLLPIMTYVIIRTGMPQLVTESALLQQFVNENYMMGEEGFCLTTFDTALKYVEVMSSS